MAGPWPNSWRSAPRADRTPTVRLLAVLTVGVLLVGACSGSSPGLEGAGVVPTTNPTAPSTARLVSTTTSTTLPPIDATALEANPIVSALVTRQMSNPRLGKLISDSDAAEETRCVGSALLDDLGTDRVRELISPESGVLDVESLEDFELDQWAESVAGCDDGGRRLTNCRLHHREDPDS